MRFENVVCRVLHERKNMNGSFAEHPEFQK